MSLKAASTATDAYPTAKRRMYERMSTKLPIIVSGSRAWSIQPPLSSLGVFMNTATSTMPASSR